MSSTTQPITVSGISHSTFDPADNTTPSYCIQLSYSTAASTATVECDLSALNTSSSHADNSTACINPSRTAFQAEFEASLAKVGSPNEEEELNLLIAQEDARLTGLTQPEKAYGHRETSEPKVAERPNKKEDTKVGKVKEAAGNTANSTEGEQKTPPFKWTRSESPSIAPWTATSPEVCFWSTYIRADHGLHAKEHWSLAKRATLRRAWRHIYEFPDG